MGWLQRLIGKDGTNAATGANGVPVHTGTITDAGYVMAQFELDAGTITGTRYSRAPYVSEDYRVSAGIDTTISNWNYTASAQNTGKEKHAFATMTMTQSGNGFLNINPALATASGNYAYLQSDRYFQLLGDAAIHLEIIGQITAMPPANQIFEAGFFLGTAGTAPADGAFFRLTNNGLIGVVTYNGTETTTAVLAASLTANTNGKYRISISQREVSFWINDVLGAELNTPSGNAVPFQTISLPRCYMMRNTGVVTGGMTVKIGSSHVTLKDLHTTKPWLHQMATQGNAYQGQDGDTQGQLSVWANNTAPTAVALTNTTAAFTGLGGIAAFLPTLTANNDGILFSYQNPAGSITQPPKTLVVTGMRLDSAISVVLAGGPLVLAYFVAFGHTAVSLATTESTSFATGTVKAPRRVPLGMQTYLAAAAVATMSPSIYVEFDSPIVVNPGEYFQICVRNAGTVTTTGAVTVIANPIHYFE